MGMDLEGFHPKSEKGKHFRNNLTWWPVLWHFCKRMAGDKIKIDWDIGFCNDGLALNEEQAMQLASILEEELESGNVKQWEKDIAAYNKNIPIKECVICEGTGKRKYPPEKGAGDFPCNGCMGTGKQPSRSPIGFTEENVRKFLEFVKDSGGFDIY
jgi:hypothetical protein